jgi:hypothetical protein
VYPLNFQARVVLNPLQQFQIHRWYFTIVSIRSTVGTQFMAVISMHSFGQHDSTRPAIDAVVKGQIVQHFDYHHRSI